MLMSGDYQALFAKVLNSPLDPAGYSVVHTYKEGVCSDCTILKSRTDVVLKDGKRADISEGVYLHHLNNLNLGTKDVYNWANPCPTMSSKFMGGGAASKMAFQPVNVAGVDDATHYFTSLDGTFQSGHYVDPSDKFFLQMEVVNYNNYTKDIYIEVEQEWVPGKAGKMSTYSVLPATGRYLFKLTRSNG
jgi:hypothetical protein